MRDITSTWLLTTLVLPLLAACATAPRTAFEEDDQGPSNQLATPGGSGGGNAGGGSGGGGLPTGPGSGPGLPPSSGCAEAAKLVYLVSKQKDLWAYNPTVSGMGAYRLVGRLTCNSTSKPQTMGVDRTGAAWVFYSDGSLHKVDVTTGACSATGFSYPDVLPFESLNMGSGFTALGGDASRETFFLLRNVDGLSTFETSAGRLRETGKLTSAIGELTGGPDGRLFVFSPLGAPKSSEVNTTTYALTTVKTFPSSFFSWVHSFAFARYAGAFHMFTAATAIDSPDTGTTKTTIYDPATDTVTTRDADIGFTVVGAGQSVCVPPPPVR